MQRSGASISGWIFVLSSIFLFGFFTSLALRRTDFVIRGIGPHSQVDAPELALKLDPGEFFRHAVFVRRSRWLRGDEAARVESVTFPAAQQPFAPANAAGSLGRTVVLGGTNFPVTDSGFSAALAAAGVNGSVILPQGAVVTLTSEHTVSTDGTTINCAAGAGFVSGVDGINLITITGNSDQILGCHLWAGSSPLSTPVFLWNSSSARIERNAALGFAGIRASFVYLVGAQSTAIQDNQCIAGSSGASCVFGEKNTVGTIVKSNNLDESLGASGSHAITFHSTDSDQSVSGTKILGNQIMAGEGFCVEVGAFGGDTPQGIVISANICKMSKEGLGGFSVGSAAKFWTVSNNTFDANGFEPSISCIEVAGASDGTVVGNSCDGGNISLSNSQAQRVTISSNLIYGLKAECAGIYLGTSVKGGIVNDNLVIGNLIHLPAGMAAIGIWQQCNALGAICDNNRYSDNTIVSDGSAGSIGIKLEDDYGISKNESVGPNTFRSPVLSVDPVGWVSYSNTQTGRFYASPRLPDHPPVSLRNPVDPKVHIR